MIYDLVSYVSGDSLQVIPASEWIRMEGELLSVDKEEKYTDDYPTLADDYYYACEHVPKEFETLVNASSVVSPKVDSVGSSASQAGANINKPSLSGKLPLAPPNKSAGALLTPPIAGTNDANGNKSVPVGGVSLAPPGATSVPASSKRLSVLEKRQLQIQQQKQQQQNQQAEG